MLTLSSLAKSLTVMQPLAGNIWNGGETRFIQWSFVGATPNAVITIFLSNSDPKIGLGSIPYTIAANLPAVPHIANVIGYRWTIPFTLRPSDKYFIRIVGTYPNDPNIPPVTTIMEQPFILAQPS
jgi:hypothetical protein